MVTPEPEGLIMYGEFPVTCRPVDLKGQISYQFISSSVQREIWPVCYSALKLIGNSWSTLTSYFTLETCCFPREAHKGRDGTRKARDWDSGRVCVAEDEKSTVAKEAPKQAGEGEGMSQIWIWIWIWIHSVSLIPPKHLAESNSSPQNPFASGKEPISRISNLITGFAPSFMLSVSTPSDSKCYHLLQWQLLENSTSLLWNGKFCGPSSLKIQHTNEYTFSLFAWIAQRHHNGVYASEYARYITELFPPQI